MSFDLLLSAVAKHIQLTEEEKKFFTSLLHIRHIPRKQFTIKQGDICDSSLFVVIGCLRGFTIDQNGMEHVLSFAPSGWWMADVYSFITQRPGQLNIEAIQDTQALLLFKRDQELLYKEVPKFERFFRILIENSLVANQQRIIDNMSLTAEERYLKFCRTYPTLINTLSQKQIASFLGVTPEFFSRMRSQLLRR